MPYLEPFERSAFTIPEAHREQIVQQSPRSFSDRFHDRSTRNLLLRIESHRSQSVSSRSQTLRKSLVFRLFSKAIAFDFFPTKKSTPESVCETCRGDSHRREKSKEPIRTTVGRKLPYLEPFELCAFTVQETHRKQIVQQSPRSFSQHFHDRSTQNLLLLIECHRSQRVSLRSQTLRKSLSF